MTDHTQVDPIERFTKAIRRTLSGHLGCEVLAVGEGQARGRMRVEDRHLHPGGAVHTGAICTLADSVAAWATVTLLGEGEGFSTLEFKTNFFVPVRDGVLIAEARALHRGRGTIVLESRVVDHESTLVALMVVTQAVLQGEDAHG